MDDLFISCVAADQPTADALTEKLQQENLTVTSIRLGLGDSLIYRTEQGFRKARCGVLILSPDFFKKPWPRSELDKLAVIDREFDEQTRLFPVWKRINQPEIARYSPPLARRIGAPINSPDDTDAVAAELLETIRPTETPPFSSESLLKSDTINQVAAGKSTRSFSLNDPHYLYDALKQYFSRGELADLAWDMDIDFEEIPGDTKSDKARELVDYSQRRGRLDELSRQVQQRRPFITY
jgi:hypothetical protein